MPKWFPESIDPLEAERKWVAEVMPLLEKNSLQKNDYLLWSAYHAYASHVQNTKAVFATLPLFFEKADSPAMVKQSMTLLKNITAYIYPCQFYLHRLNFFN